MWYFVTCVLLLAPGEADAQPPANPPAAAQAETQAKAARAAKTEAKPPAGEASSSSGVAKASAASKKGAAQAGEKTAEKGGEKSAEKTAAKPGEKTDGKAKEEEPADEEAGKTPWDEAREIGEEILNSGAMGYMLAGGFFMWPILILGIAAAGVSIERYRSLKMVTSDTAALRRKVLDLLQADQVEEALRVCDAEQGPIPAVLSAGLRKFLVLRRLNYDAGRIEEQVTKTIDDYGVHILAALEKHLPVLATVSSAAPMLGFLGTVQGMVLAFADIVATMGERNIVEAAASGIMVALLTTVLGLIVGIPAYIIYNYFTSVINQHVLEVEESAAELIEAVTLQLALGSGRNESAES